MKDAIIFSLGILAVMLLMLAFYILKQKYDYRQWQKQEKKKQEARKRRRDEFYFKVRDRI